MTPFVKNPCKRFSMGSTSKIPGDRIRLALVVDGYSVPQWVHLMIRQLLELEWVDLSIVVCAEPRRDGQGRELGQMTKGDSVPILVRAYNFIDRVIYRSSADAFARCNIMSLVKGRSVIELYLGEERPETTARPQLRKNTDKPQFDLIVISCSTQESHNLPFASRLGIWRLSHFYPHCLSPDMGGFASVVKGWKDACIALVMDEGKAGTTKGIALSWSGVHRSVTRTLNEHYFKSSCVIAQNLAQLRALGENRFLKRVISANQEDVDLSLGRRLSSSEIFNGVAGQLRRAISSLWTRVVYRRDWILLWRGAKDGLPQESPERYVRIQPARGHSWADPCIVSHGSTYLFFEDFKSGIDRSKGCLYVTEINDRGQISKPQLILERPYHLSYPFVFHHDGAWYLVPESAGNRTIELYKATEFPFTWALEAYLMTDIQAYDTTIFFDAQKVWMFCSVKRVNGASAHDELNLFYTDDLLNGVWKAHPLNPIVSDVKSSRPAGRIFRMHDKLYRPSQDCTVRYGHSLVFNEILQLTETEYEEIPRFRLDPNWARDVLATHTFSQTSELTVIDALVQERRKFIDSIFDLARRLRPLRPPHKRLPSRLKSLPRWLISTGTEASSEPYDQKLP